MRTFHLGVLISITDGHLVAPNQTDDIYEILNYMSNDELETVQLGRVADECKPYLFEQFPFLREIDGSSITRENVWGWLAEQVAKYGEWHEVRPMHFEDHETLSPIEDALRINPNLDIIQFGTEPDEPSTYGEINWKVDNDEGEVS